MYNTGGDGHGEAFYESVVDGAAKTHSADPLYDSVGTAPSTYGFVDNPSTYDVVDNPSATYDVVDQTHASTGVGTQAATTAGDTYDVIDGRSGGSSAPSLPMTRAERAYSMAAEGSAAAVQPMTEPFYDTADQKSLRTKNVGTPLYALADPHAAPEAEEEPAGDAAGYISISGECDV